MSSKSGTPIQARITRLMQASQSGSGKGLRSLSSSTPSSCRKRQKSGRVLLKKKTAVPTKQDGTPNVTTNGYDMDCDFLRFRPKSTTINACYTPSSLFKLTKTTASCSKKSSPPVKTKLTPKSHCSTPSKTKYSNRSFEKKDENTEISNLTVAIRIRPLNRQECSKLAVKHSVRVNGNQVKVLANQLASENTSLSHKFDFELVFDSSNLNENLTYVTQKDVFDGIGLPLLDKAFNGYNACLFAYGQTGSGKSYSMIGNENDDGNFDTSPDHEAGIIPRFCYELFRRINELRGKLQTEVEVSYFEIYNEKIHDLLCTTHDNLHCGCTQRSALKVREHPVWGPYVVGLSVHAVQSYDDLRKMLKLGNKLRATAATAMNDKSSRSHSIFNITINSSEVEQCNSNGTSPNKALQVRRSKISLVDLAGSERITYSNLNCDRMREGVSINKSLLTLGKVIAALADSKKNPSFVPYRDSVLTWLLRESLGGNSKTVMLATISPANIHLEETLATLRYACQARTIINRVKRNEDRQDQIIRELRAEVSRLKSLRIEYERNRRLSSLNEKKLLSVKKKNLSDEHEVEILRTQLAETERQLSRALKTSQERMKENEEQRKTEQQILKRKGLALELSVEQKQACLVNLSVDPTLSGILFYILPPGSIKVGRSNGGAAAVSPAVDIVLDGTLVGPNHCTIQNIDGNLFVVPEDVHFETYLNGELVKELRQMYHGDRLVIGDSHYFLVSNPFCSDGNRKMFERQEFTQKQEHELRDELEKEKFHAMTQIEKERLKNERDYIEKIELLELEKLKYKCNQEILETEKKILEDKAQWNNEILYTPKSAHKSNLLDEISKIMHHPSEESLHKTQIMVKKANQVCREHGVSVKFRQIQVLDNFGLFRPCILILDKNNQRKAEWPTARLGVWLNLIEGVDIQPENLFNSVDIEWKPYKQDLDDIINDSFNMNDKTEKITAAAAAATTTTTTATSPNTNDSSVLTVNRANVECNSAFSSGSSSNDDSTANSTSSFIVIQSSSLTDLKVKTKSPIKSKSLNATRKQLTYDNITRSAKSPPNAVSATATLPISPEASINSLPEDFPSVASSHVRDIQRSAFRLKKLYDHFKSDENNPNRMKQIATVENIRKNLENLDSVLQRLRTSFTDFETKKVSPTKPEKSVRFLLD